MVMPRGKVDDAWISNAVLKHVSIQISIGHPNFPTIDFLKHLNSGLVWYLDLHCIGIFDTNLVFNFTIWLGAEQIIGFRTVHPASPANF